MREESFYFYPVFATQIMNEGWASYWHARLLREADFIPEEIYLDAIKCHSDVVRPVASGEQVALSINPYHLGFTLWEEIIKQSGVEAARRIMREDDDFSFLRNHLTREIAADMGLFRFQRRQNGPIKVVAAEVEELQESLLLDKYNFGAPRVAAAEVRNDGTLILEHDAQLDGRGLDAERSLKVLGVHQAGVAPPGRSEDRGCGRQGGRVLVGVGRGRLKRRSIRRIVGLQECDRRLQHLEARGAARQPMVLVLQGHELHRLAGFLERVRHQLALLVAHHGVVLAMDQQDGCGHGIDVLDRGDGLQGGIVGAGDAQVAIVVLLRLAVLGVAGTYVDRSEHARQIRDPGDRHGAAIDRRIQGRAGKRRIPSVTGAYDADAFRVDDSLLGQIADAIRKVGLHLPSPLPKPWARKLWPRSEPR